MRMILATLLAFFAAGSLAAQSEQTASKEMASAFVQLYNAGRYDSIYALFSPEMQKALPLNKTTDFLASLETQAGKIKTCDFVKYQMGTYALYKTHFDRALFGVNISVNEQSRINGLFIKPFTDESLPVKARNTTVLALPFKGEWTVVWGGDTKELNYHVESQAQKNAFDILVRDEKGKSYKGSGRSNEDYYAFGKELYAPCDAEVVQVVDGVKDNKPGELNPIYVPGNSIILKTAQNEYIVLAHFKQHSILVQQGQKVRKGQLLGQCGNSGNSSEPHLHFHLQNVEDMNVATGVKCYFGHLWVNGQEKSDYSPVKDEKIKGE